MRLIVGLGNPGNRYQNTFHNTGFLAIECLATHLNITSWNNKFQGHFVKSVYRDHSYILLKPSTFMNRSGQSIVACKEFFKLAIEDILVLSDDLDLPLGKIRYRISGGHGGHNGLRNIIELTKSKDFHRLRMGIGRPDSKKNVDYVLNAPRKDQEVYWQEMIRQSVKYQLDFIAGEMIQVQSLN